jgi:hypothetical protein
MFTLVVALLLDPAAVLSLLAARRRVLMTQKLAPRLPRR